MKIRHKTACISEEVEGACKYAKKFVEYKNTKPEWANMYHDMAMQELEHAENLLKMLDEWVATLAWVSVDDQSAMDYCRGKMAEKSALVRMMLNA